MMHCVTHVQAVTYYDPDLYPPIVNSACLLAMNGFDLELFCRDNGERWKVSYPAQVHIHRIKAEVQGSWREYALFVAAVLRRSGTRSAIFVGHDTYGLLPAWLLAARYRRPWVYHCHDFVERERPLHIGGCFLRAFERSFARTADLVIVPDAERGALIARALRLKRPPLIVANAPLARPKASGEMLHQALEERGINLERIVFRQGRVGSGHAIEATLRSIPHWADKRWGFAVMGIGDAAYCKQLEALAQALGVQRQFVILPPVGYDQVAQFTPGADVGHALYEPITINHATPTTSSNKMMEYMAAGLPLLVSDKPSLRALVEEYGCGITADQDDPGSIATAVNVLLSNPSRAHQMGAKGAKAFEQVFCYERQFAPVLDAFRALAGYPPGEGS